jgi:oligopeptide transport system substrate-binding protein
MATPSRAPVSETQGSEQRFGMSSLQTQLVQLETSDLIRQAQDLSELEYLFRHALIQEAAYSSLLRADRRALHRAVGEALEQFYPERLEEFAAVLGWHFAEAGDYKKAVAYLLQAGDRARTLHAFQEAIQAYLQALTLLKAQGDHDLAARTLMKLGLTYHTIFDFEQSRLAYEEGFALWHAVSSSQQSPPPSAHLFRLSGAAPPSLDPGMAGLISSGEVLGQLFSGLVELSPQLNVRPDVARRWEVLDGGRTYRFDLRDDVYWSDGQPVIAADFECAWKRILAPAAASPNAGLLYDIRNARAFHQQELDNPNQLGIRALDPLTLLVELEEPTSYFPHLLTHYPLGPVPCHLVSQHGAGWTTVEPFVSNGPFRLVSGIQETGLRFERNPKYHGRVTGNLQQVELVFADEGRAALARFAAGELDVVQVPRTEVELLKRQILGEHLSAPILFTRFLSFRLDQPPFDDPRVRRAFALGTDRNQLVETVHQGLVAPATGGLIPPGMPAYSPGLGWPFDPAQARVLLAEAGYPAGRGFPAITIATYGEYEDIVAYLQAHWETTLGVWVAWHRIGPEIPYQQSRQKGQIFFSGWQADYPDPDTFLRVCLTVTNAQWSDPAYQQLLDQARRITEQQARTEIYREADRLLIAAAPILPLFYGRRHLLLKPWVKRFPTSPLRNWFWKDIVVEGAPE